MPGPESIARAEALLASGKLSPEQAERVRGALELERAKVGSAASLEGQKQREASSIPSTAPKPTPPQDEFTGSRIAFTPQQVEGMPQSEWARERQIRRNDRDETKRSASRRVSLYAEPYYEGKPRGGLNRPYAYYEPTEEMIANQLEAYIAKAPKEQQAHLADALNDIRAKGKKSVHYAEAADKLWKTTRDEFERAGLPVQRVAFTGLDQEGQEPLQTPDTISSRAGMAINKIKADVAPVSYGADKALVGGLIDEALPGIFRAQDNGDPEQAKVIEKLRSLGVLPTEAQAKGQEYDPVLSLLGGLGGVVATGGGGLAGGAGKLGLKAEGAAAKWLPGTTLGARLARAGAGGAVAGAVGAGGESVVHNVAEAVRGRQAPLEAVENVAEDTVMGGAVGLAAGPAMELLSGVPGDVAKLAKGVRDKIRTGPMGDDIRTLEVGGGSLNPILGARLGKEGQALANEALEPRTMPDGTKVAVSQEQAAVGPLAKESVEGLQRSEAESMARMEAENQAGYRRLAQRSGAVNYPIVNEVMNLVIRREHIPFTERSRYMNELKKMADFKVMLKSDAAASIGTSKLSAAEAQSLGLDVESLYQKAFKNGLSGRSRDDMVVTVTPREMSAQELDEATAGLGRLIQWGKDPDSKDRTNQLLYDALVKTRKQFGDEWAAVKSNHDETLRELEDKQAALNLQGRSRNDLGANEDLSRAESAWAGFGEKGAGQMPKNESLLKTVGEQGKRRAQVYAGNKAQERLSSASGLPTGQMGMLKAGSNAAQLRADPVFGFMSSAGSSLDSGTANAALRQAVQSVVGKGVKVPDSVLRYVATILGVTEATMGDGK